MAQKPYYFVSWNVNGIRAVAKKKALRWIDEEVPDILGLQEVKAEEEQFPDDLFEHRYAHRYVSSSHKKGQSGVALFTDLEVSYASACYEVDILREGRINEVHFDNIAFFNVYFPNGKRSEERLVYKLEFYDRFLDRIESLRKEGKSIIFCGDVNTAHRPIDLARPKENEEISGFLPVERAWIDRLLDLGYIDTFRYVHGDEPERYSWWSMRTKARQRNVGWRIDYFFVSEDLKDRIVDADILDRIEGSDHAPITLRLKR
ncbi:exodeoxyribonuclease III [Nitratifractor sp.]